MLNFPVDATFQVPLWFDVPAHFLMGLTGALRAMERDYDIVGVVVLAILTGAGGGLARDIVLSNGPPALLQNQYLVASILAAVFVALFVWPRLPHCRSSFPLLEAGALCIFSVSGTLKGMNVGLPPISCVVVGGITSIGGSLLRDVVSGRFPPSAMVPGELHGLLGIFTSGLFVLLVMKLGWSSIPAALLAIAVGFTLRLMARNRKWTTQGLRHLLPDQASGVEPHRET